MVPSRVPEPGVTGVQASVAAVQGLPSCGPGL